MKKKATWKEPRLPAAEIAELALGIFKGEIFTSNQIGESDRKLLPVIFLPLALLSGEQRKEFAAHPPAMLCGRMAQAMPRSINGYPCLSGMQMIYAQDAWQILNLYKKLQAATVEVLKDGE